MVALLSHTTLASPNMQTTTGVDRSGRVVRIGDRVRLLAIRPSILKRITGKERADVSSMLGQILEVFDVYDTGLVWVNLIWKREDGMSEVHAIAVDPDAIELISRSDTAEGGSM
jgi:hypothetical protein